MTEKIIEIQGLSKSFGKVQAVKNLNLTVRKGEIFSFLGTNGAGKSTTISLMCNQLQKDSGQITIASYNIEKNFHKVSPLIGIVYQNSVLDKQLTVLDNLKSRAALYGITGSKFKERLVYLVDLLDFSDFLNRAVGKLSGGQRRRIDIARALINKPQILILDEPTTGLDPGNRKLLWKVLLNLKQQSELTIFLTTHYMEEANIADSIAILKKGSIQVLGTPNELKTKYAKMKLKLTNVSLEQITQLNHTYKQVGKHYELEVTNSNEVVKMIQKNPQIFNDFELSKGSIDDIFLAVTKEKL